jgi:exopolysaccharide biosynthesis polyprenyl glycosylphosphotransferase
MGYTWLVQVEPAVPVSASLPARSSGARSNASLVPLSDALAVCLGVTIAHRGFQVPMTTADFAALAFCGLAAPVGLAALGQYESDVVAPGNRLRSAVDLLLVAALTLVLGLALPGGPAFAGMRTLALAAIGVAGVWILARCVTAPAVVPQRTLVVGSGESARRVTDLARMHGENGLEVVGLLDDDALPQAAGGVPVLGGLADVESVLRQHRIDRVIVTFTRAGDSELVELVRLCDSHSVAIDVVPRLFDVIRPNGSLLGGLALSSATRSRHGWPTHAAKRAVDVLAPLGLLVLFAPALVCIAAYLKLTSRGPVIYRQERIGKDGRPFEVLKFRTMAIQGEAPPAPVSGSAGIGALVSDIKGAHRPLVPLGAWLRRTSLDELPQLWCVLTGRMSLVGPRPLRPFEVAALETWELERLAVRPGLTGLWQVLGRSDAPWDERMRLDYLYARHWSLGLDIRILARTLPAVVRQRGAC